MTEIFHVVFIWLQGLSNITGLTYREINIIVYFILIPLSWIFLYEHPINKYKISIIYIIVSVFWILLSILTIGFNNVCDWLFLRSVDFLNSFPFVNDGNLNYIVSSVIICVVIPVLIYIPLIKRNWAYIKEKWLYILFITILFNLIVLYGIYRFKYRS